MRRSAAPSRLGVKRPRFNPPFATHTPINSLTTTSISKSTSCFSPPSLKPPVVTNSTNVPVVVAESKKRPRSLVNSHRTHVNRLMGKATKQLGHVFNTKENIAECNSDNEDDSFSHMDIDSSVVECKTSELYIDKPASEGRSLCSNLLNGENVDDLQCKKDMRVKFVPPAIQQKIATHCKDEDEEPECNYYAVLWCKMSKKKHKKWEGDALLVTKGKSVTLLNLEGKEIAKSRGYKSSELCTMEDGHTLLIGGKEIEVINKLRKEDWTSGRCFQVNCTEILDAQHARPAVLNKGFSRPNKENATNTRVSQSVPMVAMFDPERPNSLVLPRPSQEQQLNNSAGLRGVVDVVVDPHLSKDLRPHQREGIVFLYECVMGIRNSQGYGAILADDMGLGKTLQCIALVWTLLKQNPFGGSPVLRRVIITTPGSLVQNWCHEFRKWLGVERIKVYAVGGDKKVQEFIHSPVYPVMVISYEMFVRSIDAIRRVKFDLLICDEGHRLKNTDIKTTILLSSLPVKRRILLTGTPIQNDLQEFHALIEFCNPGVLGSSSSFHHVYEAPIVASRQPDATSEERQLGLERGAELLKLTKQFVLRRSQDINNKYLPPKVENVVFCRPSTLQIQLYRALLKSHVLNGCLNTRSDGTLHLMCIAAVKKLCSGPSMILPACLEAEHCKDDNTNSSLLYQGLHSLYPDHFTSDYFSVEYSGKLKVLSELLHSVHQSEPTSKVVVVSGYTQTLDLLQRLCHSAKYSFSRLDGSTPTSKRQQLVDKFNSNYSKDFVFLLSSKAGGVGLNLIGANRLVLYDVDWNPANDLQAMARVWRDGQSKAVSVYRLLTTGTIEEKIYQRQVSKQGLSGVVDANINSMADFAVDDLKDLFTLHEESSCVTHDLLNCVCSSIKLVSNPQSPITTTRSCQLGQAVVASHQRHISMDKLHKWKHIHCPLTESNLVDPHLLSKDITFIFRNEVNQSAPALCTDI